MCRQLDTAQFHASLISGANTRQARVVNMSPAHTELTSFETSSGSGDECAPNAPSPQRTVPLPTNPAVAKARALVTSVLIIATNGSCRALLHFPPSIPYIQPSNTAAPCSLSRRPGGRKSGAVHATTGKDSAFHPVADVHGYGFHVRHSHRPLFNPRTV